jgi:undecaprenyl-diphosphatase
MIETIDQLDKVIFLFLNGLHQDWLDAPMRHITNTPTWIPFYLLIVGFLFWKFKKQAFLALLAIALSITFADRFTSGFMKPFFERPRPCYDAQISTQVYHYVGCGGQYGFASSHAANTFALAMCLFLLFRNSKEQKLVAWLMFAWASLVSYSRIYVGVHYLTDILVGGMVGALGAYLIFYIGKLLKMKPFVIDKRNK